VALALHKAGDYSEMEAVEKVQYVFQQKLGYNLDTRDIKELTSDILSRQQQG